MTEAGVQPDAYEPGATRATDSQNFAVHNYENRANKQVILSPDLYLAHFPYEARIQRTQHGPDADHVLNDFEERRAVLNAEQAVAEAKRCISCGMCFECDNCVIYCPQHAVKRVKKDLATTGRYVETDYDRCIGCHICADVCPSGYIDMGMGG